MKSLGTSIVWTLILFAAGCAKDAPASTSTPEPPPTNMPIPTPPPQGLIGPEIILDINNDPDLLKDPYGIALDSSDNIYINDAGNSRVLVFDKGGKLLAKWDKQGSGEGEFQSLGFGGIAVDALKSSRTTANSCGHGAEKASRILFSNDPQASYWIVMGASMW
jgi:hypothetical protein